MRNRLLIIAVITAIAVLAVAGPAFARGGSYWMYSANGNGIEGTYIGDLPAGSRPSPSPSRVDVAINGYASLANGSGQYINYYGDPIEFLSAPAGAALIDPGDQNPHGNYVATGGKCKVCHAVHGAGLSDGTNVTTERLLRSTVADACAFCHITNNFATEVYGGVLEDYTNNEREGGSGHASTHRTVTGNAAKYEGCSSCHAVHGANTIGDSSYILKNDPAKGVTSATMVDGGYGSFEAPVTNQRDFCLDCHDGTRRVTDTGTIIPFNNTTDPTDADFNTYFTLCGTSSCHNSVGTTWQADGPYRTQFGVTASEARNGRSHVMTSDLTNPTGQIAFSASGLAAGSDNVADNSCESCHNSGADFPHFAEGVDALVPGFANHDEIDGVCLSCHRNGAGAGVGQTF